MFQPPVRFDPPAKDGSLIRTDPVDAGKMEAK